MPQQPTQKTTPSELIGKFKGLNDVNDSIARPAGATTTQLNILDAQAGDASRRAGRTLESLDASGNPVQLIAELEWGDGGVTNIGVIGGGADYTDPTYANTSNLNGKLTDPGTPGPMPGWPSFNFPPSPPGALPDFVPIIRALSAARAYANGTDDITWPSQVWRLDFYQKETHVFAVASRDKNGIIQLMQNQGLYYKKSDDLVLPPISPATSMALNNYWVDYFCDWTLILTHLIVCKKAYNTILTDYLKTWPIDGQAAALANYTNADYFSETPDSATYVAVAQRLAAKINQTLQRVKRTPTLINCLTKTGTASGCDCVITLDEDSYVLTYSDQSVTDTITTDPAHDVCGQMTAVTTSPTWITVTTMVGNASVTFSVMKNLTGVERDGEVEIYDACGNLLDTISVHQDILDCSGACDGVSTPFAIDWPFAAAGSQNGLVEPNSKSYQLVKSNPADTWFSFTPSSGSTATNTTFNFIANATGLPRFSSVDVNVRVSGDCPWSKCADIIITQGFM